MSNSARPRVDGGRSAARGLRYQYMATLDVFLDRINDPDLSAVRVEGGLRDEVSDAVDFDMVTHDGRCLLAAQIKSKYTSGATISAATAFTVLLQLVAASDAESYLLRCAAFPGPGATQLAACLRAATSDEDLRRELEQILRPSNPGMLRLPDAPHALERLRRARLDFDTRTKAELTADLKQRLRAHRNAASQGLGEHSAGFLLEFLLGTIFDRASDDSSAPFTSEELCDLLLLESRDLARALAVRDWGVVVGSMPLLPDVPRPRLSKELSDFLAHPVPRGPRRVVLSGLSGIGKSSLAANYVAEYADQYDIIIWVSAQSDATVRASFELAASALSVFSAPSDANVEDEILRGLVHADLSRLAGRWAIVFDDATDLRRLDPWIPRIGAGDVLITTINSAPPPTLGHHLPISALEPSESIELLRRRFDISAAQLGTLEDSFRELAETLERWPLALELAAGYIHGCALPISSLDGYIRDIRRRALADDESVPVGYPRTLAAALRMSRDAMLDRARARQDRRPLLAVNALYMAAYLAPRHIPLDLIGAGIVVDEQRASGPGGEAEGHEGPMLADASRFPPGEVIRELRRHSLAESDALFSPHLDGPQASGLTIRVNTVVQELLRTDIERDLEAVSEALGNLASHADRWFHAAYEAGELRRFSDLFPHVDSLARHVVRLRLIGGRIDTLLGNVAFGLALHGDRNTGEALMRYQLQVLADPAVGTPWKVTQAKLALASSFCSSPETSSVTLDEAADLFAAALGDARTRAEGEPEAAARIAVQAASALEALTHRLPASAAATGALREAANDLVAGLEFTAMGRYAATATRIEACLATGTAQDARTAERLSRQLLSADDLLNGTMTVEAHRHLIESLVIQDRWQQAREAFSAFRQAFGVALLPLRPIASMIHNVGVRWALAAVSGPPPSPDVTMLIDEIFAWPISANVGPHTETWMARRIQLIQAIHAISQARPRSAHEILSVLSRDELAGGRPDETAAWQELLDDVRALCRSVSAVIPRDAHEGEPLTPSGDPWFDPEFRRHRQTSHLSYTRLPENADAESLQVLVPTLLAVYLEYGVDKVPTVDLAMTLANAFAALGIEALVWTVLVKVVDQETGVSSRLGSPSPQWRADDSFTGHCILYLPELGRVIAPTIEYHRLIRSRRGGPLMVRTVLFNLAVGRIVPGAHGPIARKFSIDRGPVEISMDLSRAVALDTTAPYVQARTSHYADAGRDLLSAVVNQLRGDHLRDAVLACGNGRLQDLVEGLGDAEAMVDESGHWSFLDPSQGIEATAFTIDRV